MFERKKTITVNGVSFNMILVEGDKFRIGMEEHEVDDFYMAEFPVTQELYSKVMKIGFRNTKSYDMYPDSYEYLYPEYIKDDFLFRPLQFQRIGESDYDYKRRVEFERKIEQDRKERESKIKSERERKEWQRIEMLSKSLPVNNISWLECIEFINTLNNLTGLCFALPSFEQWYFAACGGVETKGYNFSGSDDANEVGHFSRLSTKVFSPGLYVMNEASSNIKDRKSASIWYGQPGQYRPNELGIYDMSGLVYEWLDQSEMVIGGSYHSHPDMVSRKKKFGYCKFNAIHRNENLPEEQINYLQRSSISKVISIVDTRKGTTEYAPKCGNLFGFRLILTNKPKNYTVPLVPSKRIKINLSESENRIIKFICNQPNLGLIRSIICDKFIKHLKYGSKFTYNNFKGNVYNVYICPQDLIEFEAKCFGSYLSRRKFVKHCKEEFKKILYSLCEYGYNLLIHDDLGLDLDQSGVFSLFKLDFSNRNFRSHNAKIWCQTLPTSNLVTNNLEIIEIRKRILPSTNPEKAPVVFDQLKVCENLVLIEIRDTMKVHKSQDPCSEWISSLYRVSNAKDIVRLSLNCFCNFNSADNDTEGIVRFMQEKIIRPHSIRSNVEDFDCTELNNELFCQQNKGGGFEYHWPDSSGTYLVQDGKFFVLPQMVYDEWVQSLKRKQ